MFCATLMFREQCVVLEPKPMLLFEAQDQCAALRQTNIIAHFNKAIVWLKQASEHA